jgi:hypothetical protein
MDEDLIQLLGFCVEDEASDRPDNAATLAEYLTDILKGVKEGAVSPEPILSVLRKHFEGIKHTYLHPDIPINKLQNVQSKYARFLQEGEEVAGLR